LIFEIGRAGMRKSLLAHLGLNKSEWGKDDVLSWIRWKKLKPCGVTNTAYTSDHTILDLRQGNAFKKSCKSTQEKM
jgi:hypothetical protein